MPELPALHDLPTSEWIWLLACAALIGMAKAGVKGMGMITVPIMATIFGGKISAGLVLPMLSFADVFAVSYYNRHAEWKYVWKLIPAAAAGVVAAIFVGNAINDEVFKTLIAAFIIGSLVLMIVQERGGISGELTKQPWFSWFFGFLGGFSTMIGNAAGPILAVYLLSTRLPKNSFIGTGAWFFMIMNLFKIPFHIFVWETINWQSFQYNLISLPAIALGVLVGIRIVRFIPEREFRYFIIVMTFLISLRLVGDAVAG